MLDQAYLHKHFLHAIVPFITLEHFCIVTQQTNKQKKRNKQNISRTKHNHKKPLTITGSTLKVKVMLSFTSS